MTALAATPIRRIINAISDAATRWSDADFSPRVRSLERICERTGYSIPVVEYALDALFNSLRADVIESLIAGELGSLDALDDFVERPGRPKARAVPIGSVAVISSRTTIGVALVPAIFALCAKCDVIVKDREDALIGAFFATLTEEMDGFVQAAFATSWTGAEATDLRAFDAVVAFGDDATLGVIRAQLAPTAAFIPFGSKISIGYITRESLGDDAAATHTARGAARDALLYDTEGCLSLRVLFVERGGAIAPERFAELLAREIETAATEFPPGAARAPQVQAELARMRDLAVFRETQRQGRIFSDTRATYALLFDAAMEHAPSLLPRTLSLHSVDAPSDAVAFIQRHRLPIEAVATNNPRDDVRALALTVGANRIAAFGELQRPLLAANHGGRPRIAEFVRIVTAERKNEY